MMKKLFCLLLAAAMLLPALAACSSGTENAKTETEAGLAAPAADEGTPEAQAEEAPLEAML